MSDAGVRAARMRSQRLDGRAGSAAEAVRHVVGIQAQEPRAAALSIRARTEGLTVADVDRAIADERSIVRLWVMRGTLHLVAAEDAHWLHELFAPLLMPQQCRALDALEVPAADRPKAVAAIRDALAGGPLTRAELVERLERAGIDASGQRAAHLPRLAALEGHVCFGPRRGGNDTYVLVSDWLGPRPHAAFDREAALQALAQRYAAAFGPAGAEDLAAWSGLPLRDARGAWAGVAQPPAEADPPQPPVVRLLPAFDTYLLGYRSRDLAVPAEHVARVWPGGGIIRPAVAENGLVVGTWRLRGKRLEVEPFGNPPDTTAEEAEVLRFLTARAARP
jgi:hypothetical protein